MQEGPSLAVNLREMALLFIAYDLKPDIQTGSQ